MLGSDSRRGLTPETLTKVADSLCWVEASIKNLADGNEVMCGNAPTCSIAAVGKVGPVSRFHHREDNLRRWLQG